MKRKNHRHGKFKELNDSVLFELYGDLPERCRSCAYCSNCGKIELLNDDEECDIYKKAYPINEMIREINKQNVKLSAFCKDKGVKLDILTDYLHGRSIMHIKYYLLLKDRLYGKEEFEKYKNRFK